MDNELELLRAFYAEIARLTRQHQTLYVGIDDSEDDVVAVVYPADLAKALAKVDASWASQED